MRKTNHAEIKIMRKSWYYQSIRYCPVLIAQEGSALWGNTLTTALLHDQNRTIPFGLIVLLTTVPAIYKAIWEFAEM